MGNNLKVKIIEWQDTYHQTYTSVIFGGLCYHSEGIFEKEINFHNLLTNIMYFNVIGEDKFDAEGAFYPHLILYEEDNIDALYFDQDIIGNPLKTITIN